uniref:Uncharacterized protein n=1 Tax=Anguilla anguilla TaxID=7936 RepID=A0A0E9XCE8_ANGAN
MVQPPLNMATDLMRL